MAQDSTYANTSDSTITLDEVTVTAFEQNTRIISAAGSIKILTSAATDRYNKTSFVNGLNTVAGVRMEERSPASYRLNIRGSSLRSPFGVRNIKVYWNDIPITDPGGNTYFNQFSFNNFSTLEIYKGPASSMYGAGTGGLLLMRSLGTSWTPGISIQYVTGSYHLHNILAGVAWGDNDRRNQLTYNHAESDGYRQHTRSRKDNASFVSQIKISDKQQLTASILYSNLFYETPGGLTLSEFMADPKQARPAAGILPSAEQAHAAIYQKNFLAGINHQYKFSNTVKSSTSVYTAFARVQNPTFRNYERRNEPHFGGRTALSFEKQLGDTKLHAVAGGELQEGYFNTQVSKNNQGNPDTLATNDDVRFSNYSAFVQGDINVGEEWFLSAGISTNRADVEFARLNAYPVKKQSRRYSSEWSPRIALLKMFGKTAAVYVSVSKGFSPPTIAELLPSTGAISTFLEAEHGINYEIGGRGTLWRNQLKIELTGFYFLLNNALVVRKDSANADFYVNAGTAKQMGVELSIDYSQSFVENNFIRYVSVRAAQALNDFTYDDFKKETTDFSGNSLPSVPDYTLSALADVQVAAGGYVNVSYYQSSKIFLNDANTVAAPAYQVLGFRVGWKFKFMHKGTLNVYGGGDNLLDKVYSLGNDINAAGGRYYNAAPGRNYYAGVSFQFQYK